MQRQKQIEMKPIKSKQAKTMWIKSVCGKKATRIYTCTTNERQRARKVAKNEPKDSRCNPMCMFML